ncbi:MAG: hypothetical protein C5B59_08600 [Bacteroidetes bacterium]|nr:MAG: hypothetical protein C5B59_08600 [Bacteroidota bacterium]
MTDEVKPMTEMGPQTAPSQVDGQIEARDPNETSPTPTTPIQSADVSQPTANSRPMPQTTPDVSKQPPNKLHSMFDMIFHSLDPNPKFVYDNQGNRQPVMSTKGSVARGILAGAITSIINGAKAGAAAGAQAPAGPAGTMGPANLAAAASGLQAGAQTREDIKNRPQARIDEQQVRKAAAMKNTLSELQNQIAIDKLHDENWENKEAYYQKSQDLYQPVLDSFEASDKALAPGEQPLFAFRGLSHDEAMQKMQGQQGNLQPIQDGWTTQTSPDGKTFHVPTYSLVRTSGTVNTNREALTSLAQYDSRLENVLSKNSSPTLQFSPTMLLSLEKNAHQGQVAESFINNIRHGLGLEDVQGFNSAYKNDPVLRGQVDSLMNTLGSLGTHSTASALEEFMQGGKGSKLMPFFGKTPDELQDFVNEKKADALEEQAKAKSAGAIKVAEIRTRMKPMDSKMAESILSDPSSAPVDRARAEAWRTIDTKWKEETERNKQEIDRSMKVGDPKIAARLLYEGTLTLSQLKARSSDAKFIAEVTSDAQQMARSGGDPNWTPQVQEAQFKQAQDKSNQQFFGNANSLLSKGGTLDQLTDWYGKLQNVQFPVLNKWEDYLAYEAGEKNAGTAMAGFAQTALAVADDYAKVMGGSVGTDTARIQILHSMANSHNPAQWAAVMQGARGGLKSQVSERIGHNPILQQMYGFNVPENEARAKRPTQPLQPSQQKFSAVSASGKFGWDGTRWVPIPGK